MVHKNRKTGFTIVEISIASVVLVLVLGAAYSVFSSASTSFSRSTKSLSIQNELRNALTFIREEMQRASYHSKIKVTGNTINRGEQYQLYFCPNETKGNANKDIMAWTICKPKSDGESDPYPCRLSLHNGELRYLKPSANTDEIGYNKVILKNVEKVKITKEDKDPSNPIIGALINIEVWVTDTSDSSKEKLTVSAQTGARVDVKANASDSIP